MVSSISNANGRVAMPPPPLKPEEAFNKIDSANKGFITESDLASAIVKFSPEGLSLSQADAEQVAKEAFTRMDADTDGQVTSREFQDAAPRGPERGGPQTGRPQGPPQGPPPGGGQGGQGGPSGPGGPGGPSGSPNAKAASSTQSFDPADTNQDGTVSEVERIADAIKQQALATTASNTTQTNSYS